ncbi:MAG: DEAD/DEAH box helicase [Bacteroidia bacterium]|nr:DEAD/DEAH box helicase [Bacteroidia bacterium]
MSFSSFHPLVEKWFRATFEVPTEIQSRAWPSIKAGKHTLIAAPTGSGKTLAAFMSAIDDLVRQGLEGNLQPGVQVVYISPLKALSNDIERNLRLPLEGIRKALKSEGHQLPEVKAAVRTGDTPSALRTKMQKEPPHILVTTPESLYLLLTSEGGRQLLQGVHTLILDEIHALVNDKRGSHLSLSMERLEALKEGKLQRIGLSATQKPIEQVASFLVGEGNKNEQGESDCVILDGGHKRNIDLAIEIPKSELTAVMAAEVWGEVYERLEELIQTHRTTLIFVNTRRMAERLAHNLGERLGEEAIRAHHGSMSKERRFSAESSLKEGSLRCLVATASMELGIDIGSVDLVCQLGSPRSIAAFLQRVGRSGHSVKGTPRGRLFPMTRDDLVECAAIFDAIRRSELDRIVMPEKPLDILAQQIVAEVANREWPEADLYQLFKNAFPYRDLTRKEFDEVVEMISDGFTTRRGRRGAYLHHDQINGLLKSRKGARLTALLNGGAIPDNFNFDVILDPGEIHVGNLDEDFSIESMPGDIFKLGNNSWEILKVEAGKVRVADAKGKPPTIPFWFGEAPGRTEELSMATARLREEVGKRIEDPAEWMEKTQSIGNSADFVDAWGKNALDWLRDEVGLSDAAAVQLVLYLATAQAALGVMPSRETIVLERFFDEAGDMHLVVHAPFGSRLNRAWGLALRKRFCRHFNFELQAAATEDAIILSLGSTHSFPLQEVFDYLNEKIVREVLVQALLDAPMFGIRWRWNASRALAVPRMRAGRRVPPAIQRMDSEDLVALVFPDQLACLEHIVGDREVPDHPLINQTIHDCLTEAMDIDRLEVLLERMGKGELKLVARDLTEPSPLAQEIINANPYAFLDPAGLEDRRTHAIRNRRWLDPAEASELGRLSPLAIAQVRKEAWPLVRDADELHDALIMLSFLTQNEGLEEKWDELFLSLCQENRATELLLPTGKKIRVAAERLPHFEAVFTEFSSQPKLILPEKLRRKVWEKEESLLEITRGRLEGLGPITAYQLAADLGLDLSEIQFALGSLENQGFVFRGHFSDPDGEEEWCERRLLARIHKYTIGNLRKEIEPVSAQDFMRFLFRWQRLIPGDQPEGPDGLRGILEMLEGCEAPAAAWESAILPSRLPAYDPFWLDVLCLSGRLVWGRFRLPKGSTDDAPKAGPIRSTPITLVGRENAGLWRKLAANEGEIPPNLSGNAEKVRQVIEKQGASFFDDIAKGAGLLKTQTEEALAELATWGMVTSDSFTGLRALLTPAQFRPKMDGKSSPTQSIFGMEHAGRWTFPGPMDGEPGDEIGQEELIKVAWVLLKRYGVVFRRLADREKNLPPWRDLVRACRLLEARGQIRGGRFVNGVYGEQFALNEAVGLLRKERKAEKEELLVSISAADPLNLLGILTPDAKVPALTSNRILFRDGEAVALLEGKEVKFLLEIEPAKKWEYQKVLVTQHIPPTLRKYLSR